MLTTLPSESVDCCVTSPPYFGLRDNGTGRWEGGDPGCEHGVRRWEGPKQTQGAMSGHAAARDRLDRKQCHCGARRIDLQIGLEASPEAYVAALVGIFSEVRRVLKKRGTCWLNMGDSYASAWPRRRVSRIGNGSLENGKREARSERLGTGLKDKDLILMPHRAALALQAEGWWVRSEIVWAKKNCMPESVRDRPTRAHEFIFLLTRSPKYYYDHQAVREPVQARKGNARSFRGGGAYTRGQSFVNQSHVERETHGNEPNSDGQRNQRTVWSIASRPYKGAHFSTFPPSLIEPCILAGCPEGGTVLDPFAGSGTVGQVASTHGRSAILIELNPAYTGLVRERVGQLAPLEVLDADAR